MVLGPIEFNVKVRTGPLSRPIYQKRKAVLKFIDEKKDMNFTYSNASFTVNAKDMSQVPWTPPRGNTLRFINRSRTEEEVMVEFEDHDKLIDAFRILKGSYLNRCQFMRSKDVHRSRGLFTTTAQASAEMENLEPEEVVLPDRRSRVRELIDRFERLTPSPVLKRARACESLNQIDDESFNRTDEQSQPLRTLSPISDTEEAEEEIFQYQEVKPRRRFETAFPTNSLSSWRRDASIERPSSAPQGTSGFANLGNTCYMNSMLQALFSMDFFTKDLFKFCKKVQHLGLNLVEKMPMSLAFSNLASNRDRATVFQKRMLLRGIKDASLFKGNAQQDANEFLIHLLGQVHDECDKILHEHFGITNDVEKRKQNPVMANFSFAVKSTVSCNGCQNVSHTEEDNIILPVTINVLDQASEQFLQDKSRKPTIQTLLDGYMITEKVERKCELCGEKSGQRTQKFTRIPRCLIIFIKRYAFGASGSVKRDDKIDIPIYLTLDGLCSETVAPFPVVPSSTRKINFAIASPITSMTSSTINPVDPLPARRRLDLSDEKTSDTHQESGSNDILPDSTTAEPNCNSSVPDIIKDLEEEDTNVISSIEKYLVPLGNSPKKKPRQAPKSYTLSELCSMTEEEQMQVAYERSLTQTEDTGDRNKSDEISEINLDEDFESEQKSHEQSPTHAETTGHVLEKDSGIKQETDERSSRQRKVVYHHAQTNEFILLSPDQTFDDDEEDCQTYRETSTKTKIAGNWHKTNESSELSPDDSTESGKMDEEREVPRGRNEDDTGECSLISSDKHSTSEEREMFESGRSMQDEESDSEEEEESGRKHEEDSEGCQSIFYSGQQEEKPKSQQKKQENKVESINGSEGFYSGQANDVSTLGGPASRTANMEMFKSGRNTRSKESEKGQENVSETVQERKSVCEQERNFEKTQEEMKSGGLHREKPQCEYVEQEHRFKFNFKGFCSDQSCKTSTVRETDLRKGPVEDDTNNDKWITADSKNRTNDVSGGEKDKMESSSGESCTAVDEIINWPARMFTSVPRKSPSGTGTEALSSLKTVGDTTLSDKSIIMDDFGTLPIAYRPLNVKRRMAICNQIGLNFLYDYIDETEVHAMDVKDCPDQVGGVVADGNCLFRSLALYLSGSDAGHERVRQCIVDFEMEHCSTFASLKNWTVERWNAHMDYLLTDCAWGTEVELSAFASMINADMWTFYNGRWLCYRPRFIVGSNGAIPISIEEYRIGQNEGIYLLNEGNHFAPVIKPSDRVLYKLKNVDLRSSSLVINANIGFMKPSYRLVSVVSHLGQTSESGHYVCDVWSSRVKTWLHCNDETVQTTSETAVLNRSTTGYIYFYLNSELFDGMNN